jgi:SH3 domain-containing YSC84-like protein 1
MKKTLGLFFISVLTVFPASKKDVDERLNESADVFHEVMSIPEKGIPHDLLENANCVVVIPGMKKGAFIVGAKYGKGFATCRKEKHATWSAPAAIRIEGGSVGFQIGGEETDVVLLVMNAKGFNRLMSTKFTLGGEGSVAAGPVGRETTAQTDAGMKAEILSYSRARGVFAGISLTGATLRPDEEDNEALYGRKLTTKQIVDTNVHATPAADKLLAELTSYSPHEK